MGWMHRVWVLGWSGVFIGGFCCSAGAQEPKANALSADEIVARMMERNAQRQAILQHYASDRTYRLEYNGTAGEHHAQLVVHAEYTAPGRKHLTIVSESGSKVLCKEVLRKLVAGEEETATRQDWQRSMFSPESYTFALLGTDQVDGIRAWELQVKPKEATKVAYQGKIWVSMEDYATVRMLAEPVKNPSWMLTRASFDARYMRRGEVWVPERNVSTSHVRIGGKATVTIDYGNYAVLTTLPAHANGVLASDTSRPAAPPVVVSQKAMPKHTLR